MAWEAKKQEAKCEAIQIQDYSMLGHLGQYS